MRAKRTFQMSIYEAFAEHEIGKELRVISQWLERNGEVLDWVQADVQRARLKDTGRAGMSVEAILRCGILKQYWQWTYEELSFHLRDSDSAFGFARLPRGLSPTDSALQATIGLIRDETWERINRSLVQEALSQGRESQRFVRIDSTVTASSIHEPSDSTLLADAMRLMQRWLKAAKGEAPEVAYTCHRRAVKRRVVAIQHARSNEQRRAHYKVLLKYARRTLAQVVKALTRLGREQQWIEPYVPLIERILAQTQRRVIAGEAVPAGEKGVSLFEPHTDIIVKGGREVQYGHKLNLVTGKRGMVLDVVIESGNPADSTRLIPMVERLREAYGTLPRQVAADAGYASRDNLIEAKALGIEAVGLPKKHGLEVEQMTGSRWLYRKLKHFRAGIEGNISTLKRVFGLGRCTWKGLAHFKAYVISAVLAYNLSLFAKLTRQVT